MTAPAAPEDCGQPTAMLALTAAALTFVLVAGRTVHCWIRLALRGSPHGGHYHGIRRA